MGTHPHSTPAEKATINFRFCKNPGKSPTPAPPTNQPEPTPNKNKNVVGLPHEPRRTGRSISPGERLPLTSSATPSTFGIISTAAAAG